MHFPRKAYLFPSNRNRPSRWIKRDSVTAKTLTSCTQLYRYPQIYRSLYTFTCYPGRTKRNTARISSESLSPFTSGPSCLSFSPQYTMPSGCTTWKMHLTALGGTLLFKNPASVLRSVPYNLNHQGTPTCHHFSDRKLYLLGYKSCYTLV